MEQHRNRGSRHVHARDRVHVHARDRGEEARAGNEIY